MAIVYCTTKSILDAVMMEAPVSTGLRIKALAWLNQAIQDVLNQPRTWACFELPADVAITLNVAIMPSGASELVHIQLADVFYYPKDMLTDQQAVEGKSGFILTPGGTITFYPSTAETTCKIKYEVGVTTDYADNSSNTIFPWWFKNCLIAGTLMRCMENDKDGRFSSKTQMFQYQLSLCKAQDNKLKT